MLFLYIKKAVTTSDVIRRSLLYSLLLGVILTRQVLPSFIPLQALRGRCIRIICIRFHFVQMHVCMKMCIFFSGLVLSTLLGFVIVVGNGRLNKIVKGKQNKKRRCIMA